MEDRFGPTFTVTDRFSNQVNKNGRVVVLKHMFTLEEMEEDPSPLFFAALGPQRRRERGMRNSRGCHGRCVVQSKRAPCFSFVLYTPAGRSPFHLFVRSRSESQRVS